MDGYRYILNGNKFTFAKCGLNIEQNFMQAPRCPCCGQKSPIVVGSEEDLKDFLAQVLVNCECNHCAVFVIRSNGNAFFELKNIEEDLYGLDYGDDDDCCDDCCDGWLEDDEDEEDICIEEYEMKYPFGIPNYSDIGDVAQSLGLHMYGLLVEEDIGKYTVIER